MEPSLDPPGAAPEAERHRFLLGEGVWNALGTVTDAENGDLPAHGTTTVAHRDGCWTVGTELELASEPPRTTTSAYRVEPIGDAAGAMTITIESPALGVLEGRLAVLEDTILSTFASADGRRSGAECFRRLAPECYEVRGMLLEGTRLRCSWSMRLTLRRAQAPATAATASGGEGRIVAGAPERLAARQFGEDHPDRPIVLTRLMRRPEGTVVMVATGSREALERHYYEVDPDGGGVREVPPPVGEPG